MPIDAKQTYAKRLGFMPDPEVAKEIARLDAHDDCQRIVHLLTSYEFPWDITRSLELALFYTYGSNRVSRLLDRTGEFRDHGQKRYDDTRLLIAHLMESGWDGDCGRRALARMNESHAHYTIPNDDFLFVLWTFIEFPIRWTSTSAHRPMTDHEQRAWFSFWRGIGERMGLRDVPHTKAALDAFVREYSKVHMVPDPASARVAEATMDILRGWLPDALRPLAAPIVYCLLDEPAFLAAVGASPSPAALGVVVRGALSALAGVRKVWAIGAYPNRVDDPLDRTYPDHRYRIEDLVPDRLRGRRPPASKLAS